MVPKVQGEALYLWPTPRSAGLITELSNLRSGLGWERLGPEALELGLKGIGLGNGSVEHCFEGPKGIGPDLGPRGITNCFPFCA